MDIKKKSILIAGGTGLIGKHIISCLDKDQYNISVLSRTKRVSNNIQYYKWDLGKMEIEEEALKNVDIIINLAGAGIADKRWTESRKKEIIESRIKSNECLFKNLSERGIRPKAYISASAIGYYGNRGDEILTENSSVGKSGFLAQTTEQWEDAVFKLESQFERMVVVRVGLVLSTQGGALQKMLTPAKLGSAAYFGSGKQYYPWIHIDDIVQVFIEAIKNESMSGIFNGVSPEPIPVKEMSRSIKNALGGVRIVHSIPVFVLKILLGEMYTMLMNSARVMPKALLDQNFKFKFQDLDKALIDLIKREV